MNTTVKAWNEAVTIPTYGIGEPEKNPIFLEKRVYQGSSGVVYPHPVIEKIMDEKADKIWNAVYLENDFVKIMILPELGGRVQMAYDKIKERHFVYYNQVIKPALVGLTGPWISGGIEFNWPQHHRPSTYDPIDSKIEYNEDGSVTIWCSEVERMFRTKGMAGFTLHPDKAYLEIKVQLYNRTNHVQSFLWWANPAVKVNDDYQSVFPPDVNAVFDHGKRDVSSFPIATGTYYKVDYSEGVDISKYKNVPVPTSYMAIKSDYDFVGGYENDSQGGLLHVADHHQSPGKKQWTWGHGDFGQAWDRNLTDEDGPYIELMCGVYTDNQPDFSWLQPFEEKSFKQYFMPYRDLGVVKNATKDGMVNLEIENDEVIIKAYTTGVYNNAKIILKSEGGIIFEKDVNMSPSMSFEEHLNLKVNKEDCYLCVKDTDENIIVDWQTIPDELKPIPDAAKAAKKPQEINSVEQLYLQGLHIEQYRHATFDPTEYYLEGIKREVGNIRCNNAMGVWYMKRGQFEKAEPFFRTAIKTLTERSPNPYDGEPLYNLGLCLRYQDKLSEAYDNFFKATWNGAWQDSGFFHCAQIDSINGDVAKALDLVERSLMRNWLNQKARHLKIMLLRRDNRVNEALELIAESLKMDQFNYGALYEKYLLTKEDSTLEELKLLMRDYVHNYIEFSLDYAQAGFYKEAIEFINIHISDKDNVYAMAQYFHAYYKHLSGDEVAALNSLKRAAKMKPDYCFPNKQEELKVLKYAMKVNSSDSKAYYYAGNFWYGSRQYNDAIMCWEKSRDLEDSFPTVHRNLALAYFNKCEEPQKARESLEKAYDLDKTDARILMELDQLYKKMGDNPDYRLSVLKANTEALNFRDDLYLEYITLLNIKGNYTKALELIDKHQFHPWEGGEGKVSGQYLYAHVELAKQLIISGDSENAIDHLEKAEYYPYNLGEGKLPGAEENDIHFWKGIAYEDLGDMDSARKYWEMASVGQSEPIMALYYNDKQPDKIYYQGLALQKLDHYGDAKVRYNRLLKYGEKQLLQPFEMDYFAVSLPDLLIFEEDMQKHHEQYCHYMMALGYLGLGMTDEADEQFNIILNNNPYHTGALIHRDILLNKKKFRIDFVLK